MKAIGYALLIGAAFSGLLVNGASLSVPALVYSPVPGNTVGWDFTIENDVGYLVVESSDFCTGAYATPCVNTAGAYIDFIGPNFIVVGPAPEVTPVSQTFSFAATTGLGAFQIDAGATLGIYPGDIFVTYSLYSRSPNDAEFSFDDLISSGNLLQATTVLKIGDVPEPGNLGLVLAGLAVGLLWRRKRT